MKLCGVTQSYAPTVGGMRTFLHAQREWCRANDIEHVLIVPGDSDSVERDGPITRHTIRSPFVPGSSVYRLLLRSRTVLRILRTEMPDVIETHCTYNLPWTALLHRRRHGGVVVAFYMTDVPVTYVEAPLARRFGARIAAAARALAERYLRALYRRCDIVIAISPAGQQRLREIGVRDIHCVPLGVDVVLFSPAARSDELRRSLGAAEVELLLIYTGRFDSEKRADLVLDAFALLPPDFAARLLLVGDGPMRNQLERRAAEVGRAHILPFTQDRAALAATLASCDVYVSAMAHETFGLSVIEAQACGLPVVGVRGGAMMDRVRDGVDGFLVTPGSPSEMAHRIVQTDRTMWRALGERARARVETGFSWSRTFETLLQIYQTRR